jgi:hypothetical protein
MASIAVGRVLEAARAELDAADDNVRLKALPGAGGMSAMRA